MVDTVTSAKLILNFSATYPLLQKESYPGFEYIIWQLRWWNWFQWVFGQQRQHIVTRHGVTYGTFRRFNVFDLWKPLGETVSKVDNLITIHRFFFFFLKFFTLVQTFTNLSLLETNWRMNFSEKIYIIPLESLGKSKGSKMYRWSKTYGDCSIFMSQKFGLQGEEQRWKVISRPCIRKWFQDCGLHKAINYFQWQSNRNHWKTSMPDLLSKNILLTIF